MQNSPFHGPTREIGVLLFDRFSNLCLANAVEPLRAANTLSGRGLYRWQFLSIDGAGVVSSSGLPVQPDAPLSRHPGGDYLFVMPSYGFRRHSTAPTLRALRAAARRFRVVVGMDTGAWLLAAAGLLLGRRATIHWDEITPFAERFSDVDVRPDRYVIDGDRITCGGVTTTFDLILDLIEAQHGAMLRLDVASLFLHSDRPLARRADQGQGRHAPYAPVVDAALSVMRRTVETPLPVAAVAQATGVSQRALEAAFRRAFALTPQAVYRGLRLREARRLAEGTPMSVAEIAARCGYADPSALTRAFRAEFGASPRDLRRAAGAGTG
ncbi:GlxA family transcriptional regulator [Palleronia sp. KMU-117]|uniref:GlxA family transcriptional regulator n=1 Tax=Palleronia sp. KMU-117 TaxID=3434108 RepID=UPI003D70DBA1